MTRILNAALRGSMALGTFATYATAQNAEPPIELPSVVVMQPKHSTPPAAKKKSQKTTAAAATLNAPQAPLPSSNNEATTSSASLGDPTITGAAVAPDTRSGSLSVPTVDEARADLRTTPGAVSLVTDKNYKASTPAATIKDALDYVPGVFVQPKWGEDTRLSIRGSGLSRNFHGRGISLLMDGVIPISTADGASDFQEIDPTAFRFIEVYKGANALRFGANSLGGAINFVMPTGYDTDLFGARVDIGSFGFNKISASSGAAVGAIDYFITATAQEQEGFRDHSDGESQRGAFNVGVRLSEDIETRFYLNANRVRQNIPGTVTRDEALSNPQRAFVRPGEPVGFLGVGNDNVDRDYERNLDSLRVANKTAIRLLPGTVAEVGGFYFQRHLDHPILLVVDNKNDEYGGFGRLTNNSVIGDHKNRFVAGISVHNGDVRARTYRTILGDRGALLSDADQISKTTTVYAENAFSVLPGIAIIGGLQYARIERELVDLDTIGNNQSRAAAFDFWSPKVGFLWDVSESAQVFGNISRSSEAPTFNEITLNAGSVLALDVQDAITYEIGARGSFPGITWDISIYRANLDNEFQCLATGSTGTCTQINLDKSIHQGIELGFGAELVSGIFEPGSRRDSLWLNTAYTFSDFRFDDDAVFGDNELPGAPRHFLRAELLYKHPSGIYAGPNVEWVPDAYFADSANTLSTKAYALLGAKVGFDDGGRISGYLEARNLTDEAYISSTSVATIADASSALFEPGSGRAVYGGVQVRW